MLSILKKALRSTCYCYTAFVLVYMLLLLAFLGSDTTLGPSHLTVFLLFPASFCFALGHCLFADGASHGLLWHAILFFVGFFCLFYLPHAENLKASTHVIVAAAYLVVYALVMVIYTRAIKNRKRKQEKNTEYIGVYTRNEEK